LGGSSLAYRKADGILSVGRAKLPGGAMTSTGTKIPVLSFVYALLYTGRLTLKRATGYMFCSLEKGILIKTELRQVLRVSDKTEDFSPSPDKSKHVKVGSMWASKFRKTIKM